MPSGALIDAGNLAIAKTLSDPDISLAWIARGFEFSSLGEQGMSEKDASDIAYAPEGHPLAGAAPSVVSPETVGTPAVPLSRANVTYVPASVRTGATRGGGAGGTQRAIVPVVIGGAVMVFAIVSAVVSVIGGLFQIFKGGVSGAVKAALEGLRGSLASVADSLMRFAWKIANALAKVLEALQKLWTRVLQPMLDKIEKITQRIGRIIDKVLKPYLDFMYRVRRILLEIYAKFFRPIIQLIDTLRRALSILRIAHIKWADQLDARLARLEAKIASHITAALRRTSVAGRWMNVLLTARMLLQQPILCNSVYAYQGTLQRHLINSFTPPPDDARAARLDAGPPMLTMQQSVSNIQSAALYQTGDLALELQQATDRIRTGQPRPLLP